MYSPTRSESSGYPKSGSTTSAIPMLRSLCRPGINPKVVQERLRHASVSVTLDTYTHLLAPMQADAANRIAALVDGA